MPLSGTVYYADYCVIIYNRIVISGFPFFTLVLLIGNIFGRNIMCRLEYNYILTLRLK